MPARTLRGRCGRVGVWSCSVLGWPALARGGLLAGAVSGHGGPAGAGAGAEPAAAVPGVVDIEAGAAVCLAAAHGHLGVPADHMCERGGATAAKPGDGLFCVAGEVQMPLALPIVLTDVHGGREVLQEEVDRADRTAVRDGRHRLAQSRKQACQILGTRVGDLVLAEELSPQLAWLLTVDQLDGYPGQIADVGNVAHLTTYLSALNSRQHGCGHCLH